MELNIELIQIGKLNNASHERAILGPNNRYLNLIVDLIGYDILLIEGKIEIDKKADGEIRELLIKFLNVAEELLDNNITLGERELINIFESVKRGDIDSLKDVYLKKELVTTLSNGKPIYAKTINQINYLKSLENSDIIFAVGPAGTGKTFLGVCYASKLLKTGMCKKIVLVRPVVEAGEKLGFLPGDLKEKIDPYLVPLYDCLDDCFGK